jgi:peptidoglycan/xylan/chitin deacetylase (PgdA/CDA1 family)
VGSGTLAVPAAAFAEQANWLAENATVLSLDDLLNPRTPRHSLSAAITFDDGYRSVHDHAAPVLGRAGFAASVYLNTSCIADHQHTSADASLGHYSDEEFLCWEEVLALRAAGWTIGSHGTDHVDLTQCAQDVIRDNVARSRSVIEQRVGVPCRHFAYTWGRHNRQIREAVASAGYAAAVTGTHGPVQPGSDRFALPRIDVRRDYQLEDFAALLRGDWDFLRYPQMLRRVFR